MKAKSLKIKNESMFYPNHMIQLNNFDCQLLKINKRENRESNNIYYISYKINKPEHDINSINNLNKKNINFLTVCFYHVTYAFQSESTL